MKTLPKRHRNVLFCLPFLFFTAQFAFSQTWNPFPGAGSYLYTFNQGGSQDTWIHGVRVDSAGLFGSDSVYFFNKVNRAALPNEVVDGCQGPTVLEGHVYLIDQDNFFGNHMIVRPSGDFQFVSTAGDTFLLRTQVALGSTWTFTTGISATLDSISASMVLGQVDSVMHIHLSDSHEIQLSKGHGFVVAPSFLPMVNQNRQFEIVTYALWGLPDMGLGGNLPGEAGVMDFQPGDRFGRYTDYWNGQILPDRDYVHDRIQNLTVAPDSTIFHRIQERLYIKFVYMSNSIEYYRPPFATDTVYVHGSMPFLDLLPYESSTGWVQRGVFLNPVLAGRITYVQEQTYYFEPCVPAVYAVFKLKELHMTEGLGLTYEFYLNLDSSLNIENVQRLYCYRKQTDSLDNCLVLGPVTEIEEDISQFGVELVAYPTPAATLLRVEINGIGVEGPAQLKLQDLQGHLLENHRLPSGMAEVVLDVRSLASGMYLLSLEVESGVVARKKFIVQK